MKKLAKFIRIVCIILILMNIVMTFTSVVSADDETEVDRVAGQTDGSGAKSSVIAITGAIFRVFQIVGVGVALIMLTWVGIKYMTGAPEDKAEFKKSATAYIVGALVLFGTVALVQIIRNFANKNVTIS